MVEIERSDYHRHGKKSAERLLFAFEPQSSTTETDAWRVRSRMPIDKAPPPGAVGSHVRKESAPARPSEDGSCDRISAWAARAGPGQSQVPSTLRRDPLRQANLFVRISAGENSVHILRQAVAYGFKDGVGGCRETFQNHGNVRNANPYCAGDSTFVRLSSYSSMSVRY